jgi:ubiquinol-cytochrome c reductase cytochrome c subunit
MAERHHLAALFGLALAATLGVMAARGVAEAQGGQSGGAGDVTQGTGPVGQDQSQAQLIEAGRQLYLTGCVSCHGVGGIGTAIGPNITTAGEAGADFMLRTGRMPLAVSPSPQPPGKPPAYDDTEIRQLVAYVGSLGPGPPIPPVDLARGDLQAGEQLFLANCAACHNSAAVGGAIGQGRYAPSLQQTPPQQVAEAPRVGPGEMPVFGRDVLSDAQLNDIATYVNYLQHPNDPGGLNLGYTGPVAEGFVALLFGVGGLVLVIRWITRESPVGVVRAAKSVHPASGPPGAQPSDAGPTAGQTALEEVHDA